MMGYNPFGQLSMNELALLQKMNGGNEVSLLGADPFGQLSSRETMLASASMPGQTDPILNQLIERGNTPLNMGSNAPVDFENLSDPEKQYLLEYVEQQQQKIYDQQTPNKGMNQILRLLGY